MARSLYIQDEKRPHSGLKRWLIALLVLALLAGLAVGVYLYRQEDKLESHVSAYEQALVSQDYEQALALYRQAQQQALGDGLLDQQQTYEKILAEIEGLTQDRLAEVQSKIDAGETLSSQDLAFAEQMAEVTAVHLVRHLRQMAARYMSGQVSHRELQRAFDQLADLDNLRSAVGDLPQQFPAMNDAAPKVQEAEAAKEAEKYWQAHDLYGELLAEPELAGFVHEQVQLRVEQLLEAMHEPLLQEAEALMEGGRYMSAEEKLSRLQELFPGDDLIARHLETCREHLPDELVEYRGTAEFLSIRPLIVSPKRAFDGDSYAATANDAMITVSEFRKILKQLHDNDYILVDSDRLYTESRDRKTLFLPPGKKPLVLVVDALNYYASRRETGNAWDLILDEDGQVAALYPDENGNLVHDREKEIIGILDTFVAENPDFSLDGAKGTISFSGYECLFGKVIHPAQLAERNRALADNGHETLDLSDEKIAENAQEAKAILERLHQTGWRFASSTYGYINARDHGMERIVDDTEKWLERIGSLTGPVSMLNYPNGAFIPGSDERSAYLREQGFILFGGLGPQPYFVAYDEYLYVDKTPINGFSLRNPGHYGLDRLFDASSIYDHSVRPD